MPFSNKNVSRTPKVPDSWLNPKLEPKFESYQRNIMDYMIKVSVYLREGIPLEGLNQILSLQTFIIFVSLNRSQKSAEWKRIAKPSTVE